MEAVNLENHMTVGAVALYDALNEEPTPEEEEAMDDCQRARKAAEYQAEVNARLNETPRGLLETLLEALTEQRGQQFSVFLHDAMQRRDDKLIGKLFRELRESYVHACAAHEVGVA